MTKNLFAAVDAAREAYDAAKRELNKLYALRQMRHPDPNRADNQLAQVRIDRAYAEMQRCLDQLLEAQRNVLLPPLAELEMAAVALRKVGQEYRDAVAAGSTDAAVFQSKFNDAEAHFRSQLERFTG
ncbi:hypothetical protein PI87_26950 [Ralstonia sp. A12]|uniref:hypothetical protein n=1 Tax=Ralstonia sp. A12 TaxID=1217052 RepID=UPI000573C53F|nr:hypothetical protein [Ralstonia sp. A12]KHK49108.1 hypothetical protein PI87_26950 [Ralstonia sp. A12]